jgi:hypothetical protein
VPQTADYPEDYCPRLGFTSRGLGVSVTVEDVNPERLTLAYEVRFEHGPADRPDMNAAIPLAWGGATVDVLLLGVTGRDVHEGEVDYRLEYPGDYIYPNWGDTTLDHATPEQQRITLNGASGMGVGLFGLTAFDFLLEPDEEGAGYYVRELSARLSLESYDDTSGTAHFLLDGFASNTSSFVAFYAMRHHFAGRMAWVQVAGAESPSDFTQTFDTGQTPIPLE